MGKLVIMSEKELYRLEVIKKVSEKHLSQVQAANQLHITTRQVRRLLRSYTSLGPEGLSSRHRNKPSNNKLSNLLIESAIKLIADNYHDFGPTLAAEKLAELHHIYLSKETIRKFMIQAGLWVPRAQRLKRAYQPRYRRDCYGELIQIDGSEHDWFEDRAPKCTLLVYVDDATSQLMELQFVNAESTFNYFESTKRYLQKHGKPIAFYSDKFSVFRVNAKEAKGGDKITQFGRALGELNIDIICANTCQAKGRVERANKTLQDRLIKEMRLRGISTIKEANQFLPEFMESYNHKFGKAPLNSRNLHRKLEAYEDLDEIFCWKEDRTVSQSLTLQYNKVLYLLENTPENLKLVRKRVTVYDYSGNTIKIKYKGKEIPYSILHDRLQRVNPGTIVENKRLSSVLAFIQQQQEQRTWERSKSTPRRTL